MSRKRPPARSDQSREREGGDRPEEGEHILDVPRRDAYRAGRRPPQGGSGNTVLGYAANIGAGRRCRAESTQSIVQSVKGCRVRVNAAVDHGRLVTARARIERVFGFYRVRRLLQRPRRPRARWRKGQHRPAAPCPPSAAHPHTETNPAGPAPPSEPPTRPDTRARSAPSAGSQTRRQAAPPLACAASTRREARAVLPAPWPSYRGLAPGAEANRTR